MRKSPGCVVVALLAMAIPATAQTTVRVVAATTLEAVAGSRQFVPAGTDLTGGVSLSAGTCGAFSACASLSVVVTPSTTRPVVSYDCMAQGGLGSALAGGDILVLLSAAQPTAGRVVVSLPRPFLLPPGGRVSIDVGNDGDPEYTVGQCGFACTTISIGFTLEAPVQLGPGETAVRVSSTCDFGSLQLRTEFVPTTGVLVPYGSACGPTLTGSQVTTLGSSGTTRRLELQASNSVVSSCAFLAFGLNKQQIPVPPSGCVLLTDILVPVPIAVSAQGRAGLSLTVPLAVTPSTVLTQYLVCVQAPGTVWHTSNGLEIRLP